MFDNLDGYPISSLHRRVSYISHFGRFLGMARKSKLILRIFVFVGLAAFIGSLGTSTFQVISNAYNREKDAAKTSQEEELGQVSQLSRQEKGYTLVLQREPNNETALKGLAYTRIELGNFKGAIDPLERLIQKYPHQKDYQLLLADIKSKIAHK